MATDWPALRVEYVHSTMTLRELAARHDIKAAGVMRRAAREHWEAERKQLSAEVSKASAQMLSESRIELLAKFNADDLEMAQQIRAKAFAMLRNADHPSDLRALAGAVDTAQKIGRLALGAETSNSVVTTRELPATVDDFV